MRLELADGDNLYYQVHGDRGPWLVLLNGAMSSTASWIELVPALSARHRLLLLDFRDQGQSSRRGEGYAFTAQCADLLALLDHLRIERAAVLGISYGGLVAMAFASAHGDRVSRLILAAVTREPSEHLMAVGAAWEAVAETGDAHLLMRVCSPLVYSRGFYERASAWLEQRQAMVAELLTQDWLSAFVRLSRSARGYDLRAAVADIGVPTLLLCGDEDALMSPGEMFAMADDIPECTTLAIPGAGHGLFIEKPREFATAVLGFVS